MYQSTNMLQQLSISKSDDGYKIDVKMQICRELSYLLLMDTENYRIITFNL